MEFHMYTKIHVAYTSTNQSTQNWMKFSCIWVLFVFIRKFLFAHLTKNVFLLGNFFKERTDVPFSAVVCYCCCYCYCYYCCRRPNYTRHPLSRANSLLFTPAHFPFCRRHQDIYFTSGRSSHGLVKYLKSVVEIIRNDNSTMFSGRIWSTYMCRVYFS